MSSVRSASIFTAIVLQLLMFGAIASPLADSVNPYGDESKMNNDLVEKLNLVDGNTILPVIFQLNSPVEDSDEAYLTEIGFEILGHAPLVDGGLIEGTASDIRRLSTWERVEYLELDKPLDFFYLPPE